jgi:hypothetical protein
MSKFSASDLIANAEQALETWESARVLLSGDNIDALRDFINQDMLKKFIQPQEILDQWERWEAIRGRLEALGKEELNQVLTFKKWHKYSLDYIPPKKTTMEQDHEFLRLLFKVGEKEAQDYWDTL